MKSLHSWLTLTDGGKVTGTVSIFYANSFSLLACQGTYPNKISNALTPIAQISDLSEYLLFLRAYGLIYKGEPTLTFGNNGGELGVVAKPKSANFGTPFEATNILAGLISLWMIPWFFSSLYAFTIPNTTF